MVVMVAMVETATRVILELMELMPLDTLVVRMEGQVVLVEMEDKEHQEDVAEKEGSCKSLWLRLTWTFCNFFQRLKSVVAKAVQLAETDEEEMVAEVVVEVPAILGLSMKQKDIGITMETGQLEFIPDTVTTLEVKMDPRALMDTAVKLISIQEAMGKMVPSNSLSNMLLGLLNISKNMISKLETSPSYSLKKMESLKPVRRLL